MGNIHIMETIKAFIDIDSDAVYISHSERSISCPRLEWHSLIPLLVLPCSQPPGDMLLHHPSTVTHFLRMWKRRQAPPSPVPDHVERSYS